MVGNKAIAGHKYFTFAFGIFLCSMFGLENFFVMTQYSQKNRVSLSFKLKVKVCMTKSIQQKTGIRVTEFSVF